MGKQLSTLEDINQVYDKEGFVLFHTGVTEVWILDLLAEHFGTVRGGAFWKKHFEVGNHLYITFDPDDPASSRIKDSVARSSTEVRLHTDGSFESTPPKALFLQCVQNDTEGYGVSVLVDIWKVVKELSPLNLKVLLETPFQFQRIENGVKVKKEKTVIEYNNIYAGCYRNDRKSKLIPPTEEAKLALDEFEQIISAQVLQETLFLNPGDILLVDNQRMLHGRTVLSGTHPRMLRILWM
jgi:alpha-ketoglutarate-dependent taurine dioxygenase